MYPKTEGEGGQDQPSIRPIIPTMRSPLLAAGIVCLQLAFLLLIYAAGTHRYLTGPLIMAAGAGMALVAVRRRSGGRS